MVKNSWIKSSNFVVSKISSFSCSVKSFRTWMAGLQSSTSTQLITLCMNWSVKIDLFESLGSSPGSTALNNGIICNWVWYLWFELNVASSRATDTRQPSMDVYLCGSIRLSMLSFSFSIRGGSIMSPRRNVKYWKAFMADEWFDLLNMAVNATSFKAFTNSITSDSLMQLSSLASLMYHFDLSLFSRLILFMRRSGRFWRNAKRFA